MDLRKNDTRFNTIYAFLSGFFCVLIGLRPISELFWQLKIFGINLQSFFSILLFLIAVYLIIEKKTIQKKFFLPFVAVCFYVLYITLFSVLSDNFVFLGISLKTGTSLIIGLAVLLTLDKSNLQLITNFLTISVIVLTLVSYLQHYEFFEFHYFTGSAISGKLVGRVSGGLSHPNDLNRTVILFLFIVFFNLTKLKEFFRLGLLCFIAFPIYWSYHRTTYLCTVIILVLYLLYSKKYVQLTVFVGLCGAIIAKNFDYLRWFIFDQRLNFSNGFNGSRFYFAFESIRMFSESSFFKKLFGSGLFPGGRKHGDCDLSRIIYAYGVTGFVGYLSVFLSILHAATKKFNRYAFFSMVCLFSIWVIYSIFVDVTRYPAFVIMFFVCLRGSLLIIEEKANNA